LTKALGLECTECMDDVGPFVLVVDPTQPGMTWLCPSCLLVKGNKGR